MKKTLVIAFGFWTFSQALVCAAEEEGFKSLFNGKDLAGWAGREQHWSVEDGAITGRTTKEHPAEGNNFLIWKPDGNNGTVSDFELRLSYKIVPNNSSGFGNSGIQYRSKDFGNFVVGGYQADFEAGTTYSGILYEERMDGILAQRGQKTVVRTVNGKTKVEVVGSVGDSKEIQSHIKSKDWNDYVVIAKGNHLQHFINGAPTVDVLDEREEGKGAREGVLALQLHAGDPMTVQFKNIRLKNLGNEKSAKSDLEALEGDWVLAEMIYNGQKVEDDVANKIKLNIKGSEYTVDAGDGEDHGSFKVDQSVSPKSMDVVPAKGSDLKAIYEITDDTFRACYGLNGSPRPTEFSAGTDSNRMLATYKRKK